MAMTRMQTKRQTKMGKTILMEMTVKTLEMKARMTKTMTAKTILMEMTAKTILMEAQTILMEV